MTPLQKRKREREAAYEQSPSENGYAPFLNVSGDGGEPVVLNDTNFTTSPEDETELTANKPLEQAVVTAQGGSKPNLTSQATVQNKPGLAPVTTTDFKPESIEIGESGWAKPNLSAQATTQTNPSLAPASVPEPERFEELPGVTVEDKNGWQRPDLSAQATVQNQPGLAKSNISSQPAAAPAQTPAPSAASDNREKSFEDLILDRKREADEAKAESERQQKAYEQAALWTGAGELAAALVNLYGVAELGASHQTYKSFSKDWMNKADEERKNRIKRMDDIRERQRNFELQLARLRMEQDERDKNRKERQDRYEREDDRWTTQFNYKKERDAAQDAREQKKIDFSIDQFNKGLEKDQRNFEESRRQFNVQMGLKKRQMDTQDALYGGIDPKTGKFKPGIYAPRGAKDPAKAKQEAEKMTDSELWAKENDIVSAIPEEQENEFRQDWSMAVGDPKKQASVLRKWAAKTGVTSGSTPTNNPGAGAPAAPSTGMKDFFAGKK